MTNKLTEEEKLTRAWHRLFIEVKALFATMAENKKRMESEQ